VHIGEECRRVVFNLLHLEAGGSVLTIGNDTGLERTHHAPNADPLLAVSDRNRVGESEAWRARLALGCLMNVGGGVSRRLVVTPEVLEDDVPADVILLAIDTILIKPLGALHSDVSGFLSLRHWSTLTARPPVGLLLLSTTWSGVATTL